jgi:xanthine permease XanP
MSHSHEKGLLYGLEARIGPVPAFFAALQHLLASVVGIITPPLYWLGSGIAGLYSLSD